MNHSGGLFMILCYYSCWDGGGSIGVKINGSDGLMAEVDYYLTEAWLVIQAYVHNLYGGWLNCSVSAQFRYKMHLNVREKNQNPHLFSSSLRRTQGVGPKNITDADVLD